MKVIVTDMFNFTTTEYKNVVQLSTVFNDSIETESVQMDYSLIIMIVYLDELGNKKKISFNPHSDMTFIAIDDGGK